MRYVYKTKGTCSSQISFNVQGHTITDIQYTGGCSGNLKAIPRLVDGWTAEEIAAKCRGITCGSKNTSCADQLAIAVLHAAAEQGGSGR